MLQAINLLTNSRCASRYKNHFFNIIAIIEFKILFFKENYLISNILNTINLQNITIVSAFSYNTWKQIFCRGWWAKFNTYVTVGQVSVMRRRSECSTHPHSMIDWLQPQRHYIMPIDCNWRVVGGGTGYSSI